MRRFSKEELSGYNREFKPTPETHWEPHTIVQQPELKNMEDKTVLTATDIILDVVDKILKQGYRCLTPYGGITSVPADKAEGRPELFDPLGHMLDWSKTPAAVKGFNDYIPDLEKKLKAPIKNFLKEEYRENYSVELVNSLIEMHEQPKYWRKKSDYHLAPIEGLSEEGEEYLQNILNTFSEAQHAGAVTIPTELFRIAKSLRHQDNRMTRDPVFQVQVKERFLTPVETGMDPCFHDREENETCYPGDDRYDELSEMAESDEGLPEHIEVNGFDDRWVTMQECFTEDGCNRHLALNGHNYRHYHGTRIYVDTLYRNPEMIAIREFLLNL